LWSTLDLSWFGKQKDVYCRSSEEKFEVSVLRLLSCIGQQNLGPDSWSEVVLGSSDDVRLLVTTSDLVSVQVYDFKLLRYLSEMAVKLVWCGTVWTYRLIVGHWQTSYWLLYSMFQKAQFRIVILLIKNSISIIYMNIVALNDYCLDADWLFGQILKP